MPRTLSEWLREDGRKRRLAIALGIYVLSVIVYAVVAGPDRLLQHTPFNHYAHLARAWLDGRQDLAGGAPAYAQGNDFAVFEGKTYISFPPFPAVLMLPLVALAGEPENFQDGQFIVWLAGIGPAILFLVLETLRREKRSSRSELENAALALVFAFGTVYFFVAVQGTVWFAAHVVGIGLSAAFLLVALGGKRPWLAGTILACAWLTRPTTLLIAPLFAYEVLRRETLAEALDDAHGLRALWSALSRVDRGKLATAIAKFSVPIVAAMLLASWMNYARFHRFSPSAFGHEYLTVVWQGRMDRWGLFGYHYLAKNLGVMLTVLPWLPPPEAVGAAPVQINEHGLALWFTTPIYLLLLWPKRTGWFYWALALSAAGPMVMDLLYQNSGWRQFGYRFSNDYAMLLFVMLAIGDRPFGRIFQSLCAWGIAWNLFGAVSFDRAGYDRYYFREGTQQILYQAD